MTTDARSETIDQRELRRAGEYLQSQIADHEMTVLLDTLGDGKPYRHIRFAQPGTNIWSWNLITWPGHLAISGDLQDLVFARIYDMFAFFGRGSIDPRYWAEKLVAEGHASTYGRTPFVVDRYIEVVNEQAGWHEDGLCLKHFREFREHVQSDLQGDWMPSSLDEAHQLLAQFVWKPSAPVRPGDCTSCRAIDFTDSWEWDLGGWDWHFLIALHAVQYGVKAYLAAYPDRVVAER